MSLTWCNAGRFLGRHDVGIVPAELAVQKIAEIRYVVIGREHARVQASGFHVLAYHVEAACHLLW
jgi:hypothetical protein